MAAPALIWAPPQVPAVEHVSPSLLATWRKCRLRAGFQLDSATAGLQRMGLRAAVGIVAHAVLEKRYGSQEEFATAWTAESLRTHQRLAQQWKPAIPPAPQNWPAWAITKHQVARRVIQDGAVVAVVAKRARVSTSPVTEVGLADWSPALPWRERWLEDGALGLKGRPDLVERVGGVLTVVDFKTGQGDITDDQKDQLLIYASLVRSAFGELPARAEIRRSNGINQGFDIRSKAVDDAVRRTSSALALLNKAATGRRALEASPGPDTCPSCPFRVACRPFLDAYKPDWICGHVVVGRVVSTGLLGAHNYFDLDVEAPLWRSRRLRLVGLAQEALAPGQLWGVSDFEGSSEAGFARWNTLTWRWPQ
jgi:hypothetical protein